MIGYALPKGISLYRDTNCKHYFRNWRELLAIPRGRYQPKELKYYFTDLPPETANSELKRAIFGTGSSITSDNSRQQIKGSAYFYLKIGGVGLIRSSNIYSDGRQHVFYLLATESGRLFEVLECGRRMGWRRGEISGREIWNIESFREVFRSKRRYIDGKFYLQGLLKRV